MTDAIKVPVEPYLQSDTLRIMVMDKTEQCLSNNRHNGVQIQRQQLSTRKALGVLRGEEMSTSAYTASGQVGAAPAPRLLGEA